MLADSYNGKPLNSPNDVVVKSDGSVWFTDPTFGILGFYEGHKAESENKSTRNTSTFITDLEVAFTAGPVEFTESHTRPSVFRRDVIDGHVLLDRNNLALDDRAFHRRLPPAKDSSSMAAKSSREGFR